MHTRLTLRPPSAHSLTSQTALNSPTLNGRMSSPEGLSVSTPCKHRLIDLGFLGGWLSIKTLLVIIQESRAGGASSGIEHCPPFCCLHELGIMALNCCDERPESRIGSCSVVSKRLSKSGLDFDIYCELWSLSLSIFFDERIAFDEYILIELCIRRGGSSCRKVGLLIWSSRLSVWGSWFCVIRWSRVELFGCMNSRSGGSGSLIRDRRLDLRFHHAWSMMMKFNIRINEIPTGTKMRARVRIVLCQFLCKTPRGVCKTGRKSEPPRLRLPGGQNWIQPA